MQIEQFELPSFKKRSSDSYKGDYGHALIAAGSFGKMGAAVLSVKAALRSGAGLVSTVIPKVGYEIMQTSNPEAMVIKSGENLLSELPNIQKFDAIAVGPGIGTEKETVEFLKALLNTANHPMVIDADALNIISANKSLQTQIPINSILTPHIGEFKRLAGEWKTDLEKLEMQKAFSLKHQVIVILKGANTSITNTNGDIFFNTTGNAGMAKGGSGDVLTGILVSLLAQKYEPLETAKLGVYIHGLAGDFAKESLGETSMNASDIIAHLPMSFKKVEALNRNS
jgi:NAD(P)H-hydrate epimerase